MRPSPLLGIYRPGADDSCMNHASRPEQQLLVAKLVFKQEMATLDLAFAGREARIESMVRKNAA
jgi:hypothetical protein